jgi:hypothetical protein
MAVPFNLFPVTCPLFPNFPLAFPSQWLYKEH